MKGVGKHEIWGSLKGMGHDLNGMHSIGVVRMYQALYCGIWSYIEKSGLVIVRIAQY